MSKRRHPKNILKRFLRYSPLLRHYFITAAAASSNCSYVVLFIVLYYLLFVLYHYSASYQYISVFHDLRHLHSITSISHQSSPLSISSLLFYSIYLSIYL